MASEYDNPWLAIFHQESYSAHVSDPLPFQWLAKAKETCQNTVFVDVDYPQLIARKADIVAATPELRELLPNLSRNPGVTDVPLESEKYYAIGCDLGDVGKLDTLLSEQLDISQCMVLCTAEVSITYMESEPSDRLISWAASHSDSRCLLCLSMLSKSSNSCSSQCASVFWNSSSQQAQITRLRSK